MVTNARSPFRRVLLLLTAIMLVRPPVLAPSTSISTIHPCWALFCRAQIFRRIFLSSMITEVRYTAGI